MRRDERLTYINAQGRSAEFSTRRHATPYWWVEADGISGLTNDLYTAKGSGQDGVSYVSSSLAARTITITGRQTTRSLADRQSLLSLVNPKQAGRLVYRCGDIVRHIPAYIQQAPLFSNAAYADFQIVFFCPSPFWRAGDGASAQGYTLAEWIRLWEFPACLPASGWEIETRNAATVRNVVNAGDVPAGLKIVFSATGDTSNPELVNVDTQQRLALDIDLHAGDRLTITTGYGDKRAQLERGGVVTNVFNAVTGDSSWLQLAVGDNYMRYGASSTDNLDARLYYDCLYLGV